MPQWTVKLSISMSGGIAGIGHPAEPERQPGASDGDRRKEIDAEGLQLDVAVEAIFERRDDELAQRFGARAGGRGMVSTTSVPTTAATIHAATFRLMTSAVQDRDPGDQEILLIS